jgi:hypothetical protein
MLDTSRKVEAGNARAERRENDRLTVTFVGPNKCVVGRIADALGGGLSVTVVSPTPAVNGGVCR